MSAHAELIERLRLVSQDDEIPRLSAGLQAHIHFEVGTQVVHLHLADGELSCYCEASEAESGPSGRAAEVSVRAQEDQWALLLGDPPPPTYHSFTALQIANSGFQVTGEPVVIARCRPLLERIIELVVRASPMGGPPVHRDVNQIRGRYVRMMFEGQEHDVYVESAGAGIPIVFLHTAGADSRQFRAQLSDVELAGRFEMHAVDLPFHGKSNPPARWRGESYTLTQERYLAWCSAILHSVPSSQPIVIGGSMGAAMSLVLAAERPGLVRGVVAVEPPFKSKGRRNPFQHHVAVHGALHNASYVRGLMSPHSPEADRRLAAWIYSQGAPGVYTGDLAFYSDEFDGSQVAPRIDCQRTPVVLLCGTYDYSATPDDGRKLQELMPGASLVVMEGLGHFPMCENPDLFRPYLYRALETVAPPTP